MTRLQRLENAGWKIQIGMSTGNAIATKNNRTVRGSSITNLHQLIFGY